MTNFEYLKNNFKSLSFRERNIIILEEYKIIVKSNGSAPLLVASSDEYIKKMKDKFKIMYIGQENPKWLNYESDPSLDMIENKYIRYLKAVKNETEIRTTKWFWEFYKTSTDDSEMENIIWSNMYIGGHILKNAGIDNYLEIKELSLYNLISIYYQFNPDCIISVCGPDYKYKEVLNGFLEYINSGTLVSAPTQNKPLITDDNIKLYYTYHPQYRFWNQNPDSYNETTETINREIQKIKENKKIILV